MLDILWSILPIFVVIVAGHLLRRNGIPSTEFWNLNDRLVYWVLLPCLLFYKTSTSDISGEFIGPFAAALLAGLGAAVVCSLAVTRIAGVAPPAATSILQGSVRHNTFLALAISERIFGIEGLFLGALATAILTPPTNVIVISLMNIMLREPGAGGVLKSIARDLARNPLILSVGLGIGVNLLGVGRIPVLHDSTELLGRAALPIVLLAVGANLRIRAMRAAVTPIVLSSAIRFLVVPAAAWGVCLALGITGTAAYVVTIYAAVPTASSAFTIAREMGGDAPLAAGIITLQTLFGLVTVPLTLVLARNLF